jgi:cytidylate kinase
LARVSGNVIVLSGPPGAGKTTVGPMLARRSDRPAVCLALDAMFRSIGAGFVLPFLPAAREQNGVVIAATAAAAAAFARGGYDVVVEGIFGPWYLPPFRALSGAGAASVSYVVLRPDLSTTLSRAQDRDERELRDAGPITGLYEALADLGELERHVLDTTGLSPAQTVALVQEGLAAGRYRLSP